MGKAAYDRGSRLIRRQIAQDFGTAPPPEDYVPTPRPAGWGGKAARRARDAARRAVSGAKRYGRPVPSVEVLAGVVRESARVGEQTAIDAARAVLEEIELVLPGFEL